LPDNVALDVFLQSEIKGRKIRSLLYALFIH